MWCLQQKGDMWGKLQALRDYHTASEDQGKHSTAIFLLRGCVQGVLGRFWRLTILSQSSAWLISCWLQKSKVSSKP